MAPNIAPTGVLNEREYQATNDDPKRFMKKPDQREFKIVWKNIFIFLYLHLAAVYGVYLAFTSAKLATLGWAFLWYVWGGLGITAGVHRLWSHRGYKASFPLRVVLIFFNTIAFQDPVLHWARDHRLHHKFTETEADPHNSKRGFFFSHVGWLLCRKQPEVMEKGKGIDVSDLLADKVVMFQYKYYFILMPLICFIIPTIIPVYCWGETWSNSWYTGTVLRYIVTLNATWLVNSAAHVTSWGYRPYDKNIHPAQNIGVALVALGEGWHNYHHTFPWDYKTAELGTYRANPTTLFLDACSKMGLAHDLKTVSPEMIKKRVMRTGDGSHDIWGWGDKDQSEEEKRDAVIINPSKTK